MTGSSARIQEQPAAAREGGAIRVDVWVDVACPWCYIGKRRLERALGMVGDVRAEVTWRSFQLDPGAPRFGEPGAGGLAEEYLARKLGVGLEGARELNARVSALAAAEGLTYRLDRARHANTFDAHRLLQAAREAAAADELVERLFRAQFSEGARLDDPAVLRELAAAAGMDAEAVDRVLASDAYSDAVLADLREAARRGVRGVPFFSFGDGPAVTGAQSAELLADALRAAAGVKSNSP
jgi:predicted DsbA family dithiol-disulfide isomerase